MAPKTRSTSPYVYEIICVRVVISLQHAGARKSTVLANIALCRKAVTHLRALVSYRRSACLP
jgi:hypothetical protein